MKIHEQNFEHETIDLDFNDFDACKFNNCVMQIHGFGSFTFANCEFSDDCRFEFADRSRNTLKVLTELYHGGFKNIVEDIFETIRSGSPLSS